MTTETNSLLDSVFSILGVEEFGWLMEEAQGTLPQKSSRNWILSIEDDDDIAMALQLRVEELGIEFVRASNGRSGYRNAFMNSPSAILLDYELPEGNGDYVLRRLKESSATRDIPVIVVTGRTEPVVERQMRSLGASEFLNKPFNWEALRGAIQSCIKTDWR